MKGSAIRCPACGQEAFLLREPVFEGLRKVGEVRKCSACGHIFEQDEDVPTAGTDKRLDIFTAADREAKPRVFSEEDSPRFCRHCIHYVVNPFRQWCGLHQRDVQATDTCDDFAPRAPGSDS